MCVVVASGHHALLGFSAGGFGHCRRGGQGVSWCRWPWAAARRTDPAPLARQRIPQGIAWAAHQGRSFASYTVVDAMPSKVLLMSPILIDYMGNFVHVCKASVVLPRLAHGPAL